MRGKRWFWCAAALAAALVNYLFRGAAAQYRQVQAERRELTDAERVEQAFGRYFRSVVRKDYPAYRETVVQPLDRAAFLRRPRWEGPADALEAKVRLAIRRITLPPNGSVQAVSPWTGQERKLRFSAQGMEFRFDE